MTMDWPASGAMTHADIPRERRPPNYYCLGVDRTGGSVVTKPVHVHVTADAMSASRLYLAALRDAQGAGRCVAHSPARFRLETPDGITEFRPVSTVVMLLGRSIGSWSSDDGVVVPAEAADLLDRSAGR